VRGVESVLRNYWTGSADIPAGGAPMLGSRPLSRAAALCWYSRAIFHKTAAASLLVTIRAWLAQMRASLTISA
jgi:hypothetical protein